MLFLETGMYLCYNICMERSHRHSFQKPSFVPKDFAHGWKIIAGYLGRYRKDMIFLSGLGLVSALANGFAPFLIGRFFDAVTKQDTVWFGFPLWVVVLAIWLLVQVSADVTDWIMQNKSRYIGITLQGVYVAENQAKILFFPISFHKNQKTGETTDAIGRASWQIDSIVRDVLLRLAPDFLSIIIGLVVSFYISVTVGAVMCAGIITYVYMLSRILPESVKMQKDSMKAWGDAHDAAYQAVSNVYAVKQAIAEKYEERNLKRRFVNVAALLWFKIEKLWSKISFSQRVLITLVQLFIFIFAAISLSSGDMTLGDMVALVGYSAMVFRPFSALGQSWQIMQNGLATLVRVEQEGLWI